MRFPGRTGVISGIGLVILGLFAVNIHAETGTIQWFLRICRLLLHLQADPVRRIFQCHFQLSAIFLPGYIRVLVKRHLLFQGIGVFLLCIVVKHQRQLFRPLQPGLEYILPAIDSRNLLFCQPGILPRSGKTSAQPKKNAFSFGVFHRPFLDALHLHGAVL